MKLRSLRQPPKLSRFDLLFTLLPLLAWIASVVYIRPLTIDLECARSPELCTTSSVMWPDRLTLGIESSRANHLSFVTQYISGGLAAGIPLALQTTGALLGRISPPLAFAQLGTDLTILLQTVSWNGFVNELVRIGVQRPRPFVYKDPARDGANPAHYTSFYSGHTSFSSAAGLGLIFLLLGRRSSRRVLVGASSVALTLIFLTALFRVLAGRHFVTDVVAGALAGGLVALWVALLHRPKLRTSS